MIEIINLKKQYGHNLVLDIDYFKFEKGKCYLLIGSNGSGKSTLIKTLLKVNLCDYGTIKINTTNIGYVPEKFYFPDFCSINNFLLSISSLYNLENNQLVINSYCERFSLNKNMKVSKLSKGMAQKVLIIQSLIHKASLFIFDEPINGLDPEAIKDIRDTILRFNKERNVTFLIASHLLSELTKIATVYGIITNGILVEEIKAEDLNELCVSYLKIVVDNKQLKKNNNLL